MAFPIETIDIQHPTSPRNNPHTHQRFPDLPRCSPIPTTLTRCHSDRPKHRKHEYALGLMSSVERSRPTASSTSFPNLLVSPYCSLPKCYSNDSPFVHSFTFH